LFRWLFDELGMDATYSAQRISAEGLPAFVNEVRGGALNGASITLPHKETVLRLVDRLQPLAGQIGAVNCLFRSGPGVVEGFNTDADGFRLALEKAGVNLRGAAMLLLGAGGAARAGAFSAVTAGVRQLAIANRSQARAAALGQDLTRGCAGSQTQMTEIKVIPLNADAVARALDQTEVVVNATSAGLLNPAATPLPQGCQFRATHTVMDIVYRPLETPLLAQARGCGARVVDGLWMLIYQALEQLRLWTVRAVAIDLADRLHAVLAKEHR
jgi:shikimate dehydrogenase